MTAVALKDETRVAEAPVSETAAIISMIERAASNPEVDIDKMERLFTMRERMVEREARTAYHAALADMQPKLPVIGRSGLIEVRAKDSRGGRTGDVQQSTPYALWEDISQAITPVLAEHGFALTFRVRKDADRVEVTGVLSHRLGHTEDTTMSLPMDTSGSKNDVQSIGSSFSYGKRYTAIALLNIVSRGEDDDGRAAGGLGVVSQEQADDLRDLIAEVEADTSRFLRHFKVERLEELPFKQLDSAIAMLEAKRAK